MNSGLLQKLIDAGTPTALVAEVASELALAEAATMLLETRRAKDRERKKAPRNSTESTESAEIQEQGFPEVSPPAPPLPNPSKTAPYNPPKRNKFPAPDGVADDQWAAFGKQRKKPWSEHSYKLVCNKLAGLVAQGHDAGALIDLAVENNWETVWPPRSGIGKNGAAKWVSKSGYEYRGDDRAVMREAERRGDMDTYWRVKGSLERQAA